MPKTPDEKMEAMDRNLRNWRLLAIVLGIALVLAKRDTLGRWADKMEGWASNVATASAEPVDNGR